MRLIEKMVLALMPQLGHVMLRGKGGGGGGSQLDPEVRDRIMMPAYQAAENAANVTFVPGEDGEPGSYEYGGYTGYDGERISPFNAFQAQAAGLVPGALTAGHEQFFNASDTMTGLTGFNPMQIGAAGVNRGDIGNAAAQQVMNQGVNAAALDRNSIQNVMNAGVTGADVAAGAFGTLRPQARASIRDVAGQGFMGGPGLDPYMNPFTSSVIDTTLSDLDRQRQIVQQQNASSATQAGAFGGSRQGVVESETNRAFADQAARTAAGLRSQGFDTAASLQQQDQDRALQAQLANQQQDWSATQQSLDLSGQFGLANQQAGLQAALANQGVDMNVGQLNTQNAQDAAMQNVMNNLTAQQSNQQFDMQAQLANQQQDAATAMANADFLQNANLANQQAGLEGAGLQMDSASRLAGMGDQYSNNALQQIDTLMGAGDIQQQMEQSQLDLQYQDWLDEQNYATQQANILQGAASGYPAGTHAETGGKIVCSMMNESYGFGHFRNKIWLAQSVGLDPAIQRGYHKIGLPLVAFAKGKGFMNRIVKRTIEHIARRRTVDIWKQKRGKRDQLGRVYRLIFEPLCFVVGKMSR